MKISLPLDFHGFFEKFDLFIGSLTIASAGRRIFTGPTPSKVLKTLNVLKILKVDDWHDGGVFKVQ